VHRDLPSKSVIIKAGFDLDKDPPQRKKSDGTAAPPWGIQLASIIAPPTGTALFDRYRIGYRESRPYFTTKRFCDGRDIPIASGVIGELPLSLFLPGTGKA
jgi:hypothetical protein